MSSARSCLRSCLFVPGDRPDRFDKAWSSAADDVVLDLEDAVPPAGKAAARSAVAAWLSPRQPVLVRINAAGTLWHGEDAALVAHPGVRGLMVPKAELPDGALSAACAAHGKILIPLVETAIGFEQSAALARAPAVERLAFGTIDFQVDLGIGGEDDALAHFRSHLVLVSRLARIEAPLDGVTANFADLGALRGDALRAKRFGFGGKLCIHPCQIETVNETFAPDAAELEWAHQVSAAAQRAGGAAVALDGRMIDAPVLAKAQRILRAGEAARKGRRREE
jgi:citrate lyase subunit beta/citryl-CoA lyase